MEVSSEKTRSGNRLLGALQSGRRVRPVWFLVALAIVLFSIASPVFLSVFNLSNILLQSSTIGFIAIGMTFVIINGNIDLSVGSLLALTAVVSVGLQGYGLVVALAAALLLGTAIGFLNGLIVVKTGITSFIVTLAAMIGVKGLVFAYTKEESLTAADQNFTNLGTATLGPIPVIALVYLVLTLAGEWWLRNTVHGRNAIAIGGNPEAARNAGIKVDRHIIINFALVGLLSAIAGITLAMQMGSATPVLGTNYELWTITAVVLGGTNLRGGSGSVFGTFGGVLLIGILLNGMNLLNLDPLYVYIVLGCVLIGSLLIDKRLTGPAQG
jgi:ribose transport system permease protein